MSELEGKVGILERVKRFDIDDPRVFSTVMKTSALLVWASICFLSVFYTVVPFIELPVLPLEVSLFVQVLGMTVFGVALYKLGKVYYESRGV